MHDLIEKYILQILKKSLDVELTDIKLETPPKKDMWDIAFWCFILAKHLKKSPQEISGELKRLIENDSDKPSMLERVETAWPYLNFFLASNSYAFLFSEMMKSNFYGNTELNKEKTIYIDYIGANVWKPLHIWHMCTPSQGQVFVNVYKKLGYQVIADSHIWDWGIIFWKLIVAYEKYGDKDQLETNAVEHLFDLYVKISWEAEANPDLEDEFRATFKKLSSWDEELKNIWKSFTAHSIAAMNILLDRLYVKPLYNIGESFYEWIGLAKMEKYPDLTYSMSYIVTELIEKGIATKNDDGSVWIEFPEDTKLPSCILQKRDGTHGYFASDLASIKYRMDNWNIEKIIYSVDGRQQLHFKQIFYVSRAAKWVPDNVELTHAYNWFISLKDGAMSTRKWKIIKLEKLLDESELRARKIIEEKRSDMSQEELNKLAKIIWVWAIKYGYLKKSRESDSVFDWDEYMSFEWNSGPYIQYAYVRSKKILKKSNSIISYDDLNFISEEEKMLVKHLLDFPDTIQELARFYYPHILCQYVYELTKKFSSFYNNISILQEEDEQLKKSRLALLEWFSVVIEESFEILWIPLPLEM